MLSPLPGALSKEEGDLGALKKDELFSISDCQWPTGTPITPLAACSTVMPPVYDHAFTIVPVGVWCVGGVEEGAGGEGAGGEGGASLHHARHRLSPRHQQALQTTPTHHVRGKWHAVRVSCGARRVRFVCIVG